MNISRLCLPLTIVLSTAALACGSDEDDSSSNGGAGGHDPGGHGGQDHGGSGGSSAGGTTGGTGGSSTGGSGGSSGGMGGVGGHMGGMGGHMGGMGGHMTHDAGACMGDLYEAGMVKTGEDGNFDVELVMSMPTPDQMGDQIWTLRLLESGTETGVAGATLEVTPWMTIHGHGTPKDVVVTDNGDGTYEADPVNLFMAGPWEVTVEISSGGDTDSVAFTFCVDGEMADGGMHHMGDSGMHTGDSGMHDGSMDGSIDGG